MFKKQKQKHERPCFCQNSDARCVRGRAVDARAAGGGRRARLAEGCALLRGDERGGEGQSPRLQAGAAAPHLDDIVITKLISEPRHKIGHSQN